ncbi:hypothetical protein K474DRAFT_1772117 [Panus rudis PR-1116 ss-1]|nr:hypothetical protein K474DRAFT_1772117 [Panus rudis PR-1116 ss-1]
MESVSWPTTQRGGSDFDIFNEPLSLPPASSPSAQAGDVVARLKKELKSSPCLLTYSHEPFPALSKVHYPSDNHGSRILVNSLEEYSRSHFWLSNIYCFCLLVHGEARNVRIFTPQSSGSEHCGDVCLGCPFWKRSSSPSSPQKPGCLYFVNISKLWDVQNNSHSLDTFPPRYPQANGSAVSPPVRRSPLTQRVFASPSEITLPSPSLLKTSLKRERSLGSDNDFSCGVEEPLTSPVVPYKYLPGDEEKSSESSGKLLPTLRPGLVQSLYRLRPLLQMFDEEYDDQLSLESIQDLPIPDKDEETDILLRLLTPGGQGVSFIRVLRLLGGCRNCHHAHLLTNFKDHHCVPPHPTPQSSIPSMESTSAKALGKRPQKIRKLSFSQNSSSVSSSSSSTTTSSPKQARSPSSSFRTSRNGILVQDGLSSPEPEED